MMGKVKLKYIISNVYIIIIIIGINSCGLKSNDCFLENILDNIEITPKDMGKKIIIGQTNGWTDSSSLIIIIFDVNEYISTNEIDFQGAYKENIIYFHQSNIDALDNRMYESVPNNIKWKKNITEKEDDDISPPYDPISIHVEYDLKKKCIIDIIRGKGYINNKQISACMCKK